MKRMVLAVLASLAALLPIAAVSGADAHQKHLTERAAEAKRKLTAAQAAAGAERQRMIEDHMRAMREILAQMQKAKPQERMTAEQMRAWIDEHLKLMNEVLAQMMDEHHLMLAQDPLNPMTRGERH